MEIDLQRAIKKFMVPPGKKISLEDDYDTSYKTGKVTKVELSQQLQQGILGLAAEQDRLYAQDEWSLLVIMQAMDAAGKDSTIKHVFSGLNPQGCDVFSFKAPSTEELDHDYLWRCARRAPRRGEIGIFNRSYYEEVTVVRVHPEILDAQKMPDSLKDKHIWKRRFEEMNNFEKYLVNNGTKVLKIFLYVSKEEQRNRFLKRIEEPDKNWKFSADDARDRERWDDYIDAYEDCFNHTSTPWAPWYVIPADYKPFTRLVVSHLIYTTLKDMKLKYPVLTKAQKAELAKAKDILVAEEG